MPRTSGLLLLHLRAPGGNHLRTTTRVVELPALEPGEVRTVDLSGRVAAQAHEILLAVLSLEQQPGIAKKEILLSTVAASKADAQNGPGVSAETRP